MNSDAKVLAALAFILILPVAAFGEQDARQDDVRFDGHVVPRQMYRVCFLVSGPVERVLVEDGQEVKAGDVLAELSSSEHRIEFDIAQGQLRVAKARLLVVQSVSQEDLQALKAQVELAKSQLQAAQSQYDRTVRLSEKGLISKEELARHVAELKTTRSQLDQASAMLEAAEGGNRKEEVEIAQAELAVAEAQVKAAELRVNNCVLRAPANGAILSSQITLGQIADAGTVAFDLADLSNLDVLVNVPASQLPKIRIGARCVVKLRAFPDREMQGRLIHIAPVVDPASGTVGVRIKLDAPNDLEIRPGMASSVSFVDD